MDIKLQLEQKVIALSAQIIRLFYNRKISDMIPMLEKNFLWIGTYSFQWAQGLDAFIKITHSESQEIPPLLTNEHYQLQLHSGNIWVICGNYTTTYQLDTGYLCQDKVRITFIWEQNGNSFKLNHIHGSNIQDKHVSSNDNLSIPSGSFYQYVKEIKLSQQKLLSSSADLVFDSSSDETLVLRDETEQYHSLLPLEILYLEAVNQWCRVYTPFENFLTFGSLSSFEQRLPHFTRIHRSYLVNTKAIVKLRFGKIWLWNETMLPVGKSRYTQVKQNFEEVQKKKKENGMP